MASLLCSFLPVILRISGILLYSSLSIIVAFHLFCLQVLSSWNQAYYFLLVLVPWAHCSWRSLHHLWHNLLWCWSCLVVLRRSHLKFECLLQTVRLEDTFIMVWGCIAAPGTWQFIEADSIMAKKVYHNILGRHMERSDSCLIRSEFTTQRTMTPNFLLNDAKITYSRRKML